MASGGVSRSRQLLSEDLAADDIRIVDPVDYESLFDSIPTAYLVMDSDLVIVAANAAYLETLDRTREEIVGRYVFDAFPPMPDALDELGRNPVETSFKRARDTGQLDPMPIQQYDVVNPETGKPVERYWSLISAPVLDEDGRTILVLQRVEDVTDYVIEREGRDKERERGRAWQRRARAVEADLYARAQELRAAQAAKEVAARRLTSLGELALELTASETIGDLERIVVERGLSVLGADGGAIISPHEVSGWRATLPSLGPQVEVLYGNVPYDSPLPAPWVARTGERLLLPTMADGMAFHPIMAEVYEDTNRRGWAFLPLIVNGTCLGSLAVAWIDEHCFRSDELDLLDGFAAQVAQALERIRSAARQRELALAAQRMSESLQRSLLTKPPTPESLEIAVRYQPAAQEAQVGGDWYDAFVTSSGDTVLVVGDVSGHDRDAAATMGQVRNLLRGIAYDSNDDPAGLLQRLDAALRGLELETLATAVLCRVEQSEEDRANDVRRLRWSNAGHLPPLLRHADGTVEVLDGDADLLLGVNPDMCRNEKVVELLPGSTLLLYTDGLVERRDAMIDDGVERLVGLLGTSGSESPEALCDRLLESVGSDANYDDIAILVLRVAERIENGPTGHNETIESLTLPADPRAVREARRLMTRMCVEAAVPEEVRDTAVLLVSEVVTNAVMHAESEARINVKVRSEEVFVEVGDDNAAPPVLQPHDEDALGGRGITLLELASTEWGVRTEPNGKVVWFALRTA